MRPKFQKSEIKTEKPILVFAQDVSESIIANKTDYFDKNIYSDSIKIFLSKLSDSYETRTLIFGNQSVESDSFVFDHNQSNLGQLFTQVENQFNTSNLTDLIVASDGIINGGKVNATLENTNVKIHTLLLGDTNTNPDVSIQKVRTNKYAVLNNNFPLEVVVKSNVDVSNLALIISDNNEIIERRSISLKDGLNRFYYTFLASKSGTHELDVQIEGIKDEVNFINNRSTVLLEVLDYNQNILIISSCPHPDISALKNAIIKIQGTRIKSVLIKDFNESIDDYNLICFFKPFDSPKMLKILSQCEKLGTPSFTFTGNNLDKKQIYLPKIGVKRETDFKGTNIVDIYLSDDFDAFKLNKSWFSIFSSLPPVSVPFSASYLLKKNAFSLLKQKINGVELPYPIIFFYKSNETNHGVFLGEGIWKWNMTQQQNGFSTNEVDLFLQKIFQYLKKIDPKKRLKLNVPKLVLEDEPLIISSEFYNNNYELSNNNDLFFSYRDSSGKEFKKKMNRNEDIYQLALHHLSPGNYTFKAELKSNNQVYQENGKFSVFKSKKEWTDLTANHSFLHSLSGKSNSYFLNELKELANNLKNNAREKVKTRKTIENTDVIDFKWILFMLLMLPFSEWILRKYKGMI